MSYPAISLTTATVGRHRHPQKRLQTAADPASTRIRAPTIHVCYFLSPLLVSSPRPSLSIGGFGLKHFSWMRRKSKVVWVGFKDTRDVKPVPVKDALFRNNANTRTDYRTREDGNLHPVKSDKDERILADFDNKAAPAARRLISLAKKWRDEGADYLQLPPDDFEIWKQTVVVQARRTRES